MKEKLKHDSTKTFKPIIYQFLIALEKCFEMQDNESVWIEKYGDATSSAGIQIEVKDYEKDLTDLDHNIWKTLKNWLDENFDISHYHSLVLLTTQNLSENTKFNNWNSKNKEEKLNILKDIKNGYEQKLEKSTKTNDLLDFVLSDDKENKLLLILDKFTINSSYMKDNELFNKLIETRTDGILQEKKKEYINSLLGYIINPETTSTGWEIKNSEFRNKTRSLIETYTAKTKIFPKIEIELPEGTIDEHRDFLFVRKIDDINYNEVKSEAIGDFLYTRKLIADELRNYEISRKEYEHYEKEIFTNYSTKYRKASRNSSIKNQIKDSKDLYDDVTGENAPNFYSFNDTPKKYRNGLLHEIANDEENPDKLIWKLRVDNE